MFCKKVEFKDIDTLLDEIKIEKFGRNKIKLKSEMLYFYFNDLSVVGANILKQEALSIGADVALPKGAIVHEKKLVNGIIVISHYKLKSLCEKLKIQQFGLDKLSLDLLKFYNNRKFDPKIMGIVNMTDDSFYSKSRFNIKNALHRIDDMINNGASIVDIGGCSSRPNSDFISEEVEMQRVKDIICLIGKNSLYEEVSFSIDSFRPSVVKLALDNGFKIINDITGFSSDELCKICFNYSAIAVVMHMQNSPKVMQNNPSYINIINDIDLFFKERLDKLKSFGVENAYLDVGIGFGKKLEHNLALISSLSHFSKYNKEILVGLSRKGFIDKIISTKVDDRLPATIASNIRAYDNGANIFRVHDVKEHYQALKVYNSF